jgi:hypothetical protein
MRIVAWSHRWLADDGHCSFATGVARQPLLSCGVTESIPFLAAAYRGATAQQHSITQRACQLDWGSALWRTTDCRGFSNTFITILSWRHGHSPAFLAPWLLVFQYCASQGFDSINPGYGMGSVDPPGPHRSATSSGNTLGGGQQSHFLSATTNQKTPRISFGAFLFSIRWKGPG